MTRGRKLPGSISGRAVTHPTLVPGEPLLAPTHAGRNAQPYAPYATSSLGCPAVTIRRVSSRTQEVPGRRERACFVPSLPPARPATLHLLGHQPRTSPRVVRVAIPFRIVQWWHQLWCDLFSLAYETSHRRAVVPVAQPRSAIRLLGPRPGAGRRSCYDQLA